MDTGRLLTSSVSGHLEQLNLALTQFVNLPETSAADAGRATDMLVANRLYTARPQFPRATINWLHSCQNSSPY